MIDNFETQLRADLAGVEATPSPTVTQSAYQTHRKNKAKRRRATLAATGTAAAAVGVVAGLTLTSTPALTTAYVVDHVTSALSSTNEIAYADEDNTLYTWQYGNESRQLFESASGKPTYDFSQTAVDGKLTSLAVSYSARTWFGFTVPPPPAEASADACPGIILTYPALSFTSEALVTSFTPAGFKLSAKAWISAIQNGLKCGLFTSIAQPNGSNSIELKDTHAAQPTTLWVNAKTYLPIRLVAAKDGKTPGHTVNFQWLAPTKANLANLTAQIPAGFTQRKVIATVTHPGGTWALSIKLTS